MSRKKYSDSESELSKRESGSDFEDSEGGVISKNRIVDIYYKNGKIMMKDINISNTSELIGIYRNHHDEIKPLEIELFEFQKDFLDSAFKILKHSQFLINSSDTGTGKTITSIALIKEADIPAIVICPKNVEAMWVDQFLIYGIKNYKIFTYTSFSGKLEKDQNEKSELIADKMIYRTIIRKSKSTREIKAEIEPEFEKWFNRHSKGNKGGIIIFDEFHNIKNDSSASVVSKSLINYCLSNSTNIRLLFLSATPFDKIENFGIFFKNLGFYDSKDKDSIEKLYFNVRRLLEKFKSYSNIDQLDDSYDYFRKTKYSANGKNLFIVNSYKVLRENVGTLISIEDILETDPDAFNGCKLYKRNGFFKLPQMIVEDVRKQMNLLYDLSKEDEIEGYEKMKTIGSVIREIENLETILFARLAFSKINRRNNRGKFDKVVVSLGSPNNVEKVRRIVEDMIYVNEMEKIAYDYLSVKSSSEKEKKLKNMQIKLDLILDNRNFTLTELNLFNYYNCLSTGVNFDIEDFNDDKKCDIDHDLYKSIFRDIENCIKSRRYDEHKTLSLIREVIEGNGMTYLMFLCCGLIYTGKLNKKDMETFERLVEGIDFDDRPKEIEIETVSGETSALIRKEDMSSKRLNAFSRFNNLDEVKLLIMTTNVGGVGISLHNTKNKDEDRYMFMSLTYNTISVSQTSGRIFRIGVLGDCYIYTVNGREYGTAQKNIISALKSKGSNLEIAIGEGFRKDASPSTWDDYCENDKGEMVLASQIKECDANSDLSFEFGMKRSRNRKKTVIDKEESEVES